MDIWYWYYWITFWATLHCAWQIPSKLSAGNNLMGSLLLSMFGFFLWPLFLAAYIKKTKEEE